MRVHICKVFALLILIFFFFFCGFPFSVAQDSMKVLKLKAEKAEKKAEFIKLKTAFGNIAASECEDWLARYYEAFCTMAWAFEEEDNVIKEKLVQQYELMLSALETKVGVNEELEVLKIRLLQLKISMPNSNYAATGLKLFEDLGYLVKQYPKNPRLLLLMGQTILFSPKNFMGYTDEEGMDYIRKAATILEKVDPDKTLEPTWGYKQALSHIKNIQEEKTNDENTTLSRDTNLLHFLNNQNDYDLMLKKLDEELKKEPSNGLWYYYKSLIFTQIALECKELMLIDVYCDKAESFLANKASEEIPKDEFFCLKAMIEAARIRVDYQKRGLKHYLVAEQLLDTALAINPDNPRVYFLKGQNILHYPEELGGGKEAAKKFFFKSKELFEKEAKKNTQDIQWGQHQINEMLKNY